MRAQVFSKATALVVSASLVHLVAIVPATAQESAEVAALNIIVLQAEGSLNNIKTGTAREPIVRVEDRNHKPIAGAIVTFTAPQQGASGTFFNDAKTLQTVTDLRGEAVGRGFHPNHVTGQFRIQVSASYDGQIARNVINQSNIAGGGGGGAGGNTTVLGLSTKAWIIVGIAAAGAVGAGVAATRGGGGTTLTSSTSTVGAPK